MAVSKVLGELVQDRLRAMDADDLEEFSHEVEVPFKALSLLRSGNVVELPFGMWARLLEELRLTEYQLTLSSAANVHWVRPKFGDKLKNLRIQRALTQEQAAQRIRVSYSAYVQYEGNRRLPPYPTILKITRALDVDSDYFADCDYDEAADDTALPPPSGQQELGPPKPPPTPPRVGRSTFDDDDDLPTGGGDPIPF